MPPGIGYGPEVQPQAAPSPLEAFNALLAEDPEIKRLEEERQSLLEQRLAIAEQAAQPVDITPGEAFRQLLSALPGVIAGAALGGKTGLGFGAKASGEALSTGVKSIQAQKERRLKGLAAKSEVLGELQKALESKVGDRRKLAGDLFKQQQQQRFKEEVEIPNQNARAKLSADTRLQAANIGASSRLQAANISAQTRLEAANILKDSRERIEKMKLDAKAKKDKGGRPVSDKVALELASGQQALQILEEINLQHDTLTTDFLSAGAESLGEKAKSAGLPSAVASGIKGAGQLAGSVINNPVARKLRGAVGTSLTPTAEYLYQDSVRKAAQVVGRYLEGGKLSNADYEEKYAKFFPLESDTTASKAAKLDILQKMIEIKRRSDVQALGKAGFDVAPFAVELENVQKESKKESIRQKLLGAM